jgi:hypothetical protein
LDLKDAFCPKFIWVKPKSSFAVLKQRESIARNVSLYIEYQIFLTNIRNGGIRMQRYFFRQCITPKYILWIHVCQNEHEKKVIKHFLSSIFFLYLIHGAIKMYDESTCLVFFIHFILCEIYNIFFTIIRCVKELIFLMSLKIIIDENYMLLSATPLFSLR